MEIIVRSKYKNFLFDINNSIISIQSDNDKIIDNFIYDYDPVVIDNSNLFFLGETVIDEISVFNNYPNLDIINAILKILELDSKYLDKKVADLSTTEKIYLNLLRNLSILKDIVFFKNIFLGLDLNNQKKYIKIINYLKEKYLVFITSDDVNVLYKLADYSVLSSRRTIRFDECNKIYTNVIELIKLNLSIPDLSYITYKAKEEKNVKLFYSKDVRDIIKDIYKHV